MSQVQGKKQSTHIVQSAVPAPAERKVDSLNAENGQQEPMLASPRMLSECVQRKA